MKSMKNPLIASASTALLLGLGSQAAVAENPFSAETLSSGYSQLAHNHGGEKKDGEAKCGEAKCGEEKKGGEAKCGEAKCGEDKKDKDAEGKCGEGKCGA
ncbi:hypothetical protein EDC38_2047 [Marinimicrobium koreense]|uniref:Low-complexity protein n=1 Tax=Marinimicrobium koreense TaxID=306545 RepID=A0A3N1NZ01_9GAMM|nr:low-complexity protein [Marinimicrobium koreense]ROQ21423.1 hypothetical protein EDC38_2047 [Marinimicrobium koreense]